MSKLEYYCRPLVAFDPKNKEHRRWYYMFVKERSWKHCPVRFIVPEASGSNLIKMMQDDLIKYYVDREFEQEKPATAKGHRAKHLGLTAGGFDLTIESK